MFVAHIYLPSYIGVVLAIIGKAWFFKFSPLLIYQVLRRVFWSFKSCSRRACPKNWYTTVRLSFEVFSIMLLLRNLLFLQALLIIINIKFSEILVYHSVKIQYNVFLFGECFIMYVHCTLSHIWHLF